MKSFIVFLGGMLMFIPIFVLMFIVFLPIAPFMILAFPAVMMAGPNKLPKHWTARPYLWYFQNVWLKILKFLKVIN